jgi:hypothetical protein
MIKEISLVVTAEVQMDVVKETMIVIIMRIIFSSKPRFQDTLSGEESQN